MQDWDRPYVCPNCGYDLTPEHAHYRCAECGYVEPCCQGGPR